MKVCHCCYGGWALLLPEEAERCRGGVELLPGSGTVVETFRYNIKGRFVCGCLWMSDGKRKFRKLKRSRRGKFSLRRGRRSFAARVTKVLMSRRRSISTVVWRIISFTTTYAQTGRHRRLPARGALRECPYPVCIYTHSVLHLSLSLSARRAGAHASPPWPSGRRAGLPRLLSRLDGAGRAGPGPGCTWTRAGSKCNPVPDPGRLPGLRRQAEAAAGLPHFGRAPPALFSPLGIVVWLLALLCARASGRACSSVFPLRPRRTYAVERGPLGALRRCATALGFRPFICCEPWADRDCVRVVPAGVFTHTRV